MKKPASYESFRESRRLFCNTLFRSKDVFITGLLMMSVFLCNSSTLLRTAQFLLFWFYAWLTGKKNKPLLTLLVMLGVILFNLLVPYGKVLWELWGFPITQGSLLGGLHKAVTLEGLIMLSKASIRPDLRFPGSFGSLLGESLRIFERILERKSLITKNHFIEGIDALMLELSAEQEAQESQTREERPESARTLPAMLLLGGAILPILALTLISLFCKIS